MSSDALAYLDDLNEEGRIEYDDYRNLHDLISAETPTDDEREALARAWDAGHRKGIRWKRGDAPENPYRSEVPEPSAEQPKYLCAAHPFGCPEPQGEPSSIPFYDEKMRELAGVRAQGEPSDAQVEAAMQAARSVYIENGWVISPVAFEADAMREALRAAGEVLR